MNIPQEIHTIAQTYLTRIHRSGPNNITAICPFHRKADGSQERNPSFTMSLINGLYICFSCHERGNLHTFLRSVGVSYARIDRQYRDVIEEAATRTPPKANPLKPNIDFTGQTMPDSVLGFFDQCPLSLLDEGFLEETLMGFDVGFDDVHQRITYPLRDLEGRLVGISGRSVAGENPRYKVYDDEYTAWGLPERAPTEKSHLLWNAHRLFAGLYFNQGPAEVVLVEGFKACMWVHQAGVKNVLGLLGSFMSDEQKWILEHLGATVYVMLDNNEAGQKGTKYIGRSLAKSIAVKIVEYPEVFPQPSDLSPSDLRDALQHAPDYYTWAIRKVGQRPWLSGKTLLWQKK